MFDNIGPPYSYKLPVKKGNGNIQVWLKAIRGHLNWCALLSKQGFGDMILGKWKFVIRPISNKYTDNPDPSMSIVPGQLEPRDWIKPGRYYLFMQNHE